MALPERRGGDAAVRQVKKLFEKLGFSARCYTNSSGTFKKDDIVEFLEGIALEIEDGKEKPSCFLLFIMSYGSLGMVYDSECKPIEITELQSIFGDENCSSLAGKPKIFLIEACKVSPQSSTDQPTTRNAGVESAEAIVHEDNHDSGTPVPRNPKINLKDFIVGYSLAPGMKNYIHMPYIQRELCRLMINRHSVPNLNPRAFS